MTYVLALAESEGCDVFTNLAQQADTADENSDIRKSQNLFTYHNTLEPHSLIVRKDDKALVLIAGRQIVSKENIELLSLFCPIKIEDKTLGLTDLIKAVAHNGGLPIVPWGVGKWLGARGRIVANLLSSSHDCPLFLGDNGNRPSFLPEPALLQQACTQGVPILSGSDPLPLSSHSLRPGSSGSLLAQGDVSKDRPAESLGRLLVKVKPDEIRGFGTGSPFLQFASDQLRINLRKQLSRFSVS